MKRLKALVIAVLFVFFAAGAVYAAESQPITVTVTMAGVAISIGANNTWAIGTGITSSLDTNRQERTQVWNSGGILLDVTLLSSDATNWKLKTATDATGRDSFMLRAVFKHHDTTNVVPQDSFKTNDAVTLGAQDATTSLFFVSNANTGAGATGLALIPNDSVALWLWFKAPTVSTVTDEQTITLTVGGKTAD
ncbi:MAG: hypothetical protein MUP41_11440 [Desulfobacterales bacterium]|nr:hypothetical protein [Desulfobacterales bacterium]